MDIFEFLSAEFAACSLPPNRVIIVKRFTQRRNNVTRRDLNSDLAIRAVGLETGLGLETGFETNFCGLSLGLGCFAPVLVLVSNRCDLGLVAQKLVSRSGNFCKQNKWISSNSCPLNLLLVRWHQTELIIVKRFTQRCNNVTRKELNSDLAISQAGE